MATTSRRALLAGAAALSAAPAVSASAMSEPDAAIDRLWREWLRLRIEGNSGLPDVDIPEHYHRWIASERAIEATPASMMRAGAVLLVDLYWQVAGADDVPAHAERAGPGGGWALLHSFPCLRPYLTGHVAAAVDLITAEPHRSIEDLCDQLGREA